MLFFTLMRKKLIEPIDLKFGRKKITRADHVRFLGVLLDETLSWKAHLVKLSRKLARSVGIFYKLRYYVPLDTLRYVYYSLFHPFSTYGIIVWGSAFENLRNSKLNVYKNKQESGISYLVQWDEKVKILLSPTLPPPIFCRHSSKLLSPTLPKLMNWILLSPPHLSSAPDNPPKFGTCTRSYRYFLRRMPSLDNTVANS